MVINEKEFIKLIADENKILKRKNSTDIFGDEIVLGFSYIINGVKLSEPHKDEIDDFEEIDKPEEEIWQQPTEIN